MVENTELEETLTQYWYIENNFQEVRAGRIGASEVSALIPNPDKPSESLAGYGQTALSLWRQKTGREEREPAGLAAEMGKWNEVKAIELFIHGIPEIGPSLASEYVESRMRYETALLSDPNRRASRYQSTPFKHNTQWHNDQFVVHPDGIWEPGSELVDGVWPPVSAHGHTIDLSSPFLIEAKTASYWSAKRRPEKPHSGFDTALTGWQGIPLKYYVQIQFQLACMDVDVCYLPLLSDSATFNVWEVRRNRKNGDDLIDLAGRFMWYVKHDTMPKEMAINIDDICAMYPAIADDFQTVAGEEATTVIELARKAKDAASQEKAWREKKEDAQSALAVHLKDAKELRVLLDGEEKRVVSWTEREGSEYVASLSDVEKADAALVSILREKGLVKQKKGSKSVNVCWKEE